MSKRHVSASIFFACSIALAGATGTAAAATKSSSKTITNACALLSASEVATVFGGAPAAGTSTDVASTQPGTTVNECEWVASGAGTINGQAFAADTTLARVTLAHSPNMKTQFAQSTSAAAAPVAGLGLGAKSIPGAGLLILIDPKTSIIVGATGSDAQAMEATQELLAKYAIPRAKGTKKAAPSKKPAPTTTTTVGKASVNLTISGAAPAVLKGTKVRCILSTDDSSDVEVTAADYPALGADGYVSLEVPAANSPQPGFAKIGVNGMSFAGDESSASSSFAGKTLTVTGLQAMGDAGSTITIDGTVTCP